MTSHKPILYSLLALALIRGIIYASVVPPWQAPDETGHFERTRASLSTVDWNSTADNGPVWYRDLISSLFTFDFWDYVDARRRTYSPDSPLNEYIGLYQEIYGGLYSSRPAYTVMGWPLVLVRTQDITLNLYLVRLNTLFINVGIILLAYFITKTIFPNDTFLKLGVPILILFNPQHAHLLAAVNNGNLAELLATAALYFIVFGIIRGFSWLNVLAAFVFVLAAMWAKATAYFLIFAIGTVGLFYLWQYRRKWPWMVLSGLILVGLAYYFTPQRLKLLIRSAWSLLRQGDIYLDPIVPTDLFRSFWAMPGWTIFMLHPFWYYVLLTSCILAVIGLIFLGVTKRGLIFSKQYQSQIQALSILAVSIIVSISILLSWNAINNIIIYRQGRSIYPVIVPISLFLMLGWRQLIPRQWRRFGLLTITVALFLFDSIVLFHYIVPFFYSRY